MSQVSSAKKLHTDLMDGALGMIDDTRISSSVDFLGTMAKSLKDLAPQSEAAMAPSQQVAMLGSVSQKAFAPKPEIFEAVEEGDLAAVQNCLKTWDVNAMHGEYDQTVLYHAAANCGYDPSFPILNALLDAGADPRIGLGPHNGVLHGLGFGYFKPKHVDDLTAFVKRCVDLGADIEERTAHLGWTPLYSALTEWNAEATEALLRNGADPNAACLPEAAGCTAGQSALELVCSEPELFALLLDYGADRAGIRAIIEADLNTGTYDEWADGFRACLALLDTRKPQ